MKWLIGIMLLVAPAIIEAKTTRTRGYVKKNGTYVQSHQKTSSNKTKIDNYSTKGNVNPYTGKKGTK